MRRRKLLWGLLAAAVVLLLLALDNRLTVRRYRIETEKVTEPIRILVVSDLHSCAYGENQRELLAAVAAEEPDLVLLPGDIVDDVLPEDNAWTVLEALAEGKIQKSRHQSYLRLYEELKPLKAWQEKKK